MKRIILLLTVILPSMLIAQNTHDWADFKRYAGTNFDLKTKPSVVFMGDSIFDGWDDSQPEYFTENNFADRGIGGQVTSQMLVRFRADVINLDPEAVVILAGTNDLALNNGHIEVGHIVQNIMSMVELAENAGIRPILCSVLPAGKYPWRPEVADVAAKISILNSLLEEYAKRSRIAWVDLHEAMAAEDGSMKSEYTYDGVHPTADGYDVMQSVLYPFLKKYIPHADC